MKKDFIFAPILLVLGVLLGLLKVTGMPIHIALSVAGVIVLKIILRKNAQRRCLAKKFARQEFKR